MMEGHEKLVAYHNRVGISMGSIPHRSPTGGPNFLKNGRAVFGRPVKDPRTEAQERGESLLETIGQWKVENGLLKRASS